MFVLITPHWGGRTQADPKSSVEKVAEDNHAWTSTLAQSECACMDEHTHERERGEFRP